MEFYLSTLLLRHASHGQQCQQETHEKKSEADLNVVIRTLEVLSLITEEHTGLSLTEISQRLGIPLPTTHRILALVVQEQFISRDTVTLHYVPGPRLRRIAALARRDSIAMLAQPALRTLSERFNETVLLTELVDGRAICVALSESRRPLHLSVAVGQAVSLHAAASARVLYSDFSAEELDAIFADYSFTRHAPGTPTSRLEVQRHLTDTRRNGYDVCDNEFDVDVWAVAVPVRDAEGNVVAGVALTTPQERSRQPGLREEIIEQVIATAHELSMMLGAPLRGESSASPTAGH